MVDGLYLFLVSVSVFFATLIFLLVFFFALKYRRRSEDEIPKPIIGSLQLELLWTIIPLLIAMVMFGWSATLYFNLRKPPDNAMQIYVVGKQWMWKIQHPTGQREINELHVPVGRAVKLVMTSEDVIHSFYVPAFRIKMDVVPGRYTTEWFQPTMIGRYHLFCAEYCGTNHSAMIGWVTVMDPNDYQAWLAGGAAAEESVVAEGAKVFQQLRCNTCHNPTSEARGPRLDHLFGSRVTLNDGTQVIADDAYIRESILRPNAKTVAGFRQIMPTFQGQVSESQILQIIAYLKSLDEKERTDNNK